MATLYGIIESFAKNEKCSILSIQYKYGYAQADTNVIVDLEKIKTTRKRKYDDGVTEFNVVYVSVSIRVPLDKNKITNYFVKPVLLMYRDSSIYTQNCDLIINCISNILYYLYKKYNFDNRDSNGLRLPSTELDYEIISKDGAQ